MSITSGPMRALVDRQLHVRAAVGERQGGFDVGRVHCEFLSEYQFRMSGDCAPSAAQQRKQLAHVGAGPARLRAPCARSSRSSRSLSARSINASRPAPAPRSGRASCRSKKRSMNRSFSSRPRRQRHLQLAQRAFVDRLVESAADCMRSRGQTARRTISSLILPIALVGFRPFGQTSTQFMIVWQRNRRYGSSRLSRRSPVAWSRLSAMKR